MSKSRFELKRLGFALVIPSFFSIVFFATFLLQWSLNENWYALGVLPRSLEGILGIITHPLIHASWKHLMNNCFTFWILAVALFYCYREIALKTFVSLWISVGSLLWIIGRPDWHVGASTLIYALSFFLIFSGMIRKFVPLIALSFVVVFLYGNMIWFMLPFQYSEPISWEGHLAGAISGVVWAFYFRKQGPQRPKVNLDEDLSDDDPLVKQALGIDEPSEQPATNN